MLKSLFGLISNKDKYNTKINEEMLNYQQWAIDSKVKYYESL